MNATCIYCGCKENLNTQFNITVPVTRDGAQEGETEKVQVLICDDHAEDATPKTAREKYVDRQKKMDEVLAMARALGMDLSPAASGSGLTIVTSTRPQNNQNITRAMGGKAALPAPTVALEEAAADPDFVSTEVADAKFSRVLSLSGVAGHQNVEAHQQHNVGKLKEEIPIELLKGRVKTEGVERSNGSVMAIPTKKVDGLGTTVVTVVQTTDGELQRRFKHKAEMSKSERGWEMMFDHNRNGYELTNCPLCRATCTVRHLGKDIPCPKCGGRGQI